MLLHQSKHPAEIQIIHLNDSLNQQRKQLLQQLGSKTEKATGFLQKLKSKTQKKQKSDARIFVIDFKGDVQASAVEHLREEISLILSAADCEKDQVVIRLESPGGLVHGYGLAAAQLLRLRDAGLNVTICVDKVAASGGYMMACIAHKIIAAPFAVLGSIGVVAQIPNFNRFLKEHKVDFEQFTAGEYKRTVTMFGENSDEAKAKFEQELQQTHQLFKTFVEKYRPQLDIQQVATGEHWYGQDALDLHLVDELATSDAYLLSQIEDHDVYLLHSRKKPTLGEKLGLQAAEIAHHVVPTLLERVGDYVQKSYVQRVQMKK
ncbi:MAG: protease SohB [Acinetobacter sp.]|nr:protease SohB [Acinetobacter sp.]